jgi:hypothetical protein
MPDRKVGNRIFLYKIRKISEFIFIKSEKKSENNYLLISICFHIIIFSVKYGARTLQAIAQDFVRAHDKDLATVEDDSNKFLDKLIVHCCET